MLFFYYCLSLEQLHILPFDCSGTVVVVVEVEVEVVVEVVVEVEVVEVVFSGFKVVDVDEMVVLV